MLTTSEFNDVKGRLLAMHNKRKVDNPADANRPTLRRAPGSGGGGTVGTDEDGNKPASSSDDDDRPTLKRRPASE